MATKRTFEGFLEAYCAELAKAARAFDGDARAWVENEAAPERYRRVLAACEAQGDLLRAKRRMNAIMCHARSPRLRGSGMTRHRLAEGAGVNRSNLHAWLSGDDSKVESATAKKATEAAEAAAGERAAADS